MPRIWNPKIIVTRQRRPCRRWHVGAALQPIVLSAVVLGSSIAYGQNSSLFYQDVPGDDAAGAAGVELQLGLSKGRTAAASQAARSDHDRRAGEKRLGQPGQRQPPQDGRVQRPAQELDPAQGLEPESGSA